MTKNYRLVLFLIEIAALAIVSYVCTGNIMNALSNMWFSSGLLMILLLSLIDQPFFSKDSNVFVNAVTAFLALMLVQKNHWGWIFWTFFGVTVYLLVSSYILMLLRENPLNKENKLIQFFSRLNHIVGKPQIIFSAFFLWGAFLEFGFHNTKAVPLFWYWFFVILIDTSSLAKYVAEIISMKKDELDTFAIGHILGVQGRNILLVKLFPPSKRKTVKVFNIIDYKLKSNREPGKGIIIDSYLLNEEQWIKVLKLDKELECIPSDKKTISEDICYAVDFQDEKDIPFLKSFIGVVTENSDVSKICFIYSSHITVETGMLVEIHLNGKKIIYQIFNGLTKQELLEEKNKSDMIVATAIQLGIWDSANNCFNKYGWVPPINTPVHILSNQESSALQDGFIELGNVPNTSFPIIMNVNTAISHHMAVLGVTGTGKSVFVRHLLKKYGELGNKKIFIVDFTGEHKRKFQNLTPFMSSTDEKTVYDNFVKINAELDKFPNQRNLSIIENSNSQIETIINNAINSFLHSKECIKIIELPDVQNSQNIFDFTKVLFKQIFKIAKENLDQTSFPQMCIVLEEAHTIIPEWNFASEASRNSQASMNAISQIALQGRKYNVGLLVIAQRTANVSKTILTQCNSIISFAEYDNTSVEFLTNYFGESVASILPTLKPRQAIAAGKAFSSTVPMIFQVPEIQE